MTYKVTDPKGILIGGERFKKGEDLPKSATSSQVKAYLRFNQIEEATSKTVSYTHLTLPTTPYV